MLNAFGFAPMWVRWIHSLISSTFFSILINGIPSKPFSPTRGIRQGDPLSPFLFVLMAEGLGRLIKHALLSQHLKGLSIHNTPAITHQQFVDDNMLFGYPSVQEAASFKSILKVFSDASGTSINKAKSQIFFFHTSPIIQCDVARILGFSIASLPSKYLGAPLIDSAIKHASWRKLLEKPETRLSLWTYRALNMASRLTLIKVVLQAMPLYLFSILAAPKWVLKRIRDLQHNFLWGTNGTNRKWALVKWSTAYKPKAKGGLGLRDPSHSNEIMGARIWWQWLTTPNKPWGVIWTAKYANHRPSEELIRFTPMEKGSLMWNAASEHYKLIQKHGFWEIRGGNKARFWTDAWNQLPNLDSILNIQPSQDWEAQNKEVVNQHWTQEIHQGYRQWKPPDTRMRTTNHQTKESLERELLHRRIRHTEGNDLLRWGYNPRGTFTTQEAYKIQSHDNIPNDPIWEKVWTSGIWPKVSTFL